MAALEGVRLVVWLKKLTRDLGERDDDNLLSLRSITIIKV